MNNREEKKPSPLNAMPFWAWNGKLEYDELIRQIDIMKQMGFGGFFMHSRTGLITEYLGEEWFSLVEKCAIYAQSIGMQAWLYDEDRWPSGSVGGLATKNKKYRMRYISLYKSDSYKSVSDVERALCRFAVKLDERDRLIDYYQLVNSDDIIKDGYVLNIFCEELMKCSPNYNGNAYIDTMDIKCVKKFIKLTHEKYKKKCGKLFSKQIIGIFTDEPHRGALFNSFGLENENKANMAPYTRKLFSYYRKRWGEDLSCRLPELFYKGEDDWSKTSYQYTVCLNDLFINNFSKPYYSWCKKNKLLLTGHYLHEDSLRMQTSMCGSIMRCYEFMDYPGFDILGESNACYWVAKQCQSVARQLNKPAVLTELYGCTGWQMTFNNYKICTDWQIMFGASLRCPHISWYSMLGQSKRDYPSSILHQSAWYPYYSYLENYFFRLSQNLSQGDSSVDTLVINAIESMFGYVHKDWLNIFDYEDECIGALETNYERQFFELIYGHIDFDYADEDMLFRHAAIEKDGAVTYLRVGSARYSQILSQNFLHLRESTKTLLAKFEYSGGVVVDSVNKLSRNGCVSAPHEIAVRFQKTNYGAALFCLNLNRKNGVKNAKIFLPKEYNSMYASIIDLFSDSVVDVFRANDITLDFEKSQSIFLRITTEKPQIPAKLVYKTQKLPQYMRYKLSEPNVLPLDMARYSIDGKLQNNGEAMYALKIDNALRDIYGLVHRGGEMMQPWFEEKFNSESTQKLCDITLEFCFYVQSLSFSNVCIAIERFCECQLFINDVRLKTKTEKYWVDACFDIVELPIKYLSVGKNNILVKMPFNAKSGVESVYLLGDFGAQLPNILGKLPDKLQTKDITRQGLPFYSAAIEYHTEIVNRNVHIDFSEVNAALIVAKSENETKYVVSEPFQLDICATSELILECVYTRRNTFGPHHYTPYPDISYPPDTFVSNGENWTDEYILEKQGFEAKG